MSDLVVAGFRTEKEFRPVSPPLDLADMRRTCSSVGLPASLVWALPPRGLENEREEGTEKDTLLFLFAMAKSTLLILADMLPPLAKTVHVDAVGVVGWSTSGLLCLMGSWSSSLLARGEVGAGSGVVPPISACK